MNLKVFLNDIKAEIDVSWVLRIAVMYWIFFCTDFALSVLHIVIIQILLKPRKTAIIIPVCLLCVCVRVFVCLCVCMHEMGIEPRASHRLGKQFITEPPPQTFLFSR